MPDDYVVGVKFFGGQRNAISFSPALTEKKIIPTNGVEQTLKCSSFLMAHNMHKMNQLVSYVGTLSRSRGRYA